MKWATHQTGAVLGALALGMPLAGVASATAGAIWPDIIDQKISSLGQTRKKRQAIFNRVHRGPSHWFGWYAALLMGVAIYPLPPLARDAALGFFFGALSHIVLDMLTPQGVPLTPFSRKGKLAVPICSTGKLGEYIFLAVMVICGIFLFRDSFFQAWQAARGFL